MSRSPYTFPVSEWQFNSWFPHRNSFYTYAIFRDSANKFPGFMKSGNVDVQRREAAAFLANVAHETGNLIYIIEQDRSNWDSYCSETTALANGFTRACEKKGRKYQYYGRGPLQLSYNYNYYAAGQHLGYNLIENPNWVEEYADISWGTAIWFWMTQKGAGTMTPHDAIVTRGSFRETIKSINGAVECGPGGRPDLVQARIDHYAKFAKDLGI